MHRVDDPRFRADELAEHTGLPFHDSGGTNAGRYGANASWNARKSAKSMSLSALKFSAVQSCGKLKNPGPVMHCGHAA